MEENTLEFKNVAQSISLDVNTKKSKKRNKSNGRPRLTEAEKQVKFEQYKFFMTKKVQFNIGKAVQFMGNETPYMLLGLTQSNKDEHDFNFILLTADRDIVTISASNKFETTDNDANLSVAKYLWNNQRGAIVSIINDFTSSEDLNLLTYIPNRNHKKKSSKKNNEKEK